MGFIYWDNGKENGNYYFGFRFGVPKVEAVCLHGDHLGPGVKCSKITMTAAAEPCARRTLNH